MQQIPVIADALVSLIDFITFLEYQVRIPKNDVKKSKISLPCGSNSNLSPQLYRIPYNRF